MDFNSFSFNYVSTHFLLLFRRLSALKFQESYSEFLTDGVGEKGLKRVTCVDMDYSMC